MLADIRRSERRRILFEQGRLAVHSEGAEIKRLWALPKNLRIDPVAAEPVIQSDPHRVDRKVGAEALRAGRKVHATRAIVGEQIFGSRDPARRQRHFDAGAGCTADARHHEQILDRAIRGGAADRSTRHLRARELIEAVGKAAGYIIKPMAGRVADAAAQRARHLHLIAVNRLADQRRRDGLAGAEHVWKRHIGLDAKHNA